MGLDTEKESMNVVRKKALYYNERNMQICRVSELISLGEYYRVSDYDHWYVRRKLFQSRFATNGNRGPGQRLPLLVDHGRGIVLGVLAFIHIGSSRDAPIPLRLRQADEMLGTFVRFRKTVKPKIKTGYCNILYLRYLDLIGEYDRERQEYFPEKKEVLLF